MEIEQLLKELVVIPAPSGKERKRAEYIFNYLKQYGYKPYIDEVSNVIIELTVNRDEPYMLFSAHMDTVFDDEIINVVKSGSILSAPGIGDDTSNVVFLMKVLEYISVYQKKPKHNLLFAFNVCEEGTGNLKGIKSIMSDYQGRIKNVTAFDLMSDSICMKSVGSIRYKVEVESPGGHSFHNFGQKGAIEVAAYMIDKIYSINIKNSEEEKTTYNVGMISGGTSINTISQNCSFTAEVRSDDRHKLESVNKKLLKIFKIFDGNEDGIVVKYSVLGDRPTDGAVPKDELQNMIDTASEIICQHTGIMPELKSGSTDCNIPMSMGIPAISFGAYRGGGTHTRQEWVDLSFIDTGFEIIKDYVLKYFE